MAGRCRLNVSKSVGSLIAVTGLGKRGKSKLEQFFGQIIKFMGATGRIDKIGGDHGIGQGWGQSQAATVQYLEIVFEVVAQFEPTGVGQQWL